MGKLRTAFSERPRLYSALAALAVVAVAAAIAIPLVAGGTEGPPAAASEESENRPPPEGGSRSADSEDKRPAADVTQVDGDRSFVRRKLLELLGGEGAGTRREPGTDEDTRMTQGDGDRSSVRQSLLELIGGGADAERSPRR